MDTTYRYAQQQKVEAFDWNQFLAREDQTYDEWDQAAAVASDWVTCACGSMCAALPRNNDGVPLDEELRHLGTVFYAAIMDEELTVARYTMEQIEIRSAYLLSQM